jgi:hypothetical protein
VSKLLKCTWPELGLAVRFEPIADNKQVFDWWISCCPTRAMQSHAVVSGKVMYTLNIPVNSAFPGDYSKLKFHNIAETPVGMSGVFATFGKVASFCPKYGEITEPMCYPGFCMAVPEDIDTLVRVGAQVWDAIYNTKKLIRVEFSAE